MGFGLHKDYRVSIRQWKDDLDTQAAPPRQCGNGSGWRTREPGADRSLGQRAFRSPACRPWSRGCYGLV